jgi:hypothetical protein
MVCPHCGLVTQYVGLSEANLSYQEEISMQTVNSFSYKRANHFQEWLNSIQSKETTEISPEVIESVKAEFIKHRVKASSEITPGKVRQYLKKLRLEKLYACDNAICMKIKGITPMSFSVELEEQLKSMFAMVQAPFEKAIKNTKRKNFLSYSYCLYKFFQILGHDELLPYCSLLKDPQKLFLQDCIWRSICSDLDWQFIPSV